jgi:glyoxylase-like metal-dependent hydrolase (beta-lactamase superfamily II)
MVYPFMMKIITVDCNYVEPGFAASYLLVRGERAMFIECNTNFAIPHLLKALRNEGLAPEQVDGLIVTHIHLDHAGGAGLFLKTFPEARLFAHPRAARHAIDPSRLVASATAVYGDEFMKRTYGTVVPCDEDRVQVLNDGDSLFFQGVELEIRHTRGHANHHLVVFEPLTRTLFTGDSCGVTYPVLNEKHGMVALVSTSPTDFDGDAALATLDWIESRAPARIAPSHFGMIEKPGQARMLQLLRDQLRFSIDLLARIKREGLPEQQVYEFMRAWIQGYFEGQGVHLDERDLSVLELDLRVNAQGLCYRANLPV